MKKIFVIFFILGLNSNIFGQDTLFPKQYWSLIGGTNLFIPIRNYTEIYNSKGGNDGGSYEYRVKPYFTATNFLVNATYSNAILSRNKVRVSYKMALGYLHHTTKIIKKGYNYNGFTGNYFTGNISEAAKKDYLIFDLGFIINYKIKKRFYFNNHLGISTYLFFHKYENSNGVGILSASPHVWESKKNIWGNGIGIILNYKIGTVIPIHDKIWLTPYIELPLFLFGDNNVTINRSYSTPYFSSINNICLINLEICIEYKIK